MDRRLHHLRLLLHPDGPVLDVAATRRRLWWLIVGLTLLSLFLLSTGLGGGFK
jgi:hypothetical protein